MTNIKKPASSRTNRTPATTPKTPPAPARARSRKAGTEETEAKPAATPTKRASSRPVEAKSSKARTQKAPTTATGAKAATKNRPSARSATEGKTRPSAVNKPPVGRISAKAPAKESATPRPTGRKPNPAAAAEPKTRAPRKASPAKAPSPAEGPKVVTESTAPPSPDTGKPAPRTRRKAVAAPPPPPALAEGPELPPGRRAIFIDVENTSSEDALFKVIDALQIDPRRRNVSLAAVGNWRTIGPTVGRRLAAAGAQLIHSAPARGVRDWSDLWIAVAAGCWIGQATPGDRLEIVSNDRAFDAVGDAAAARGIDFRRIPHSRGSAAAAVTAERPESTEEEGEAPRRPRRSRGGRRRGRRGSERPPTEAGTNEAAATPTAEDRPRPSRSASSRRSPAGPRTSRPQPAPAAAPPAAATHALPTGPAAAPEDGGEVHGASAGQIVILIRRLTNDESSRWVNLDVLERALKQEGFSRPAGSPRLVTRLRALKHLELDSNGRVRLAQPVSSEAPPPHAAPAAATEPESASPPPSATAAAEPGPEPEPA